MALPAWGNVTASATQAAREAATASRSTAATAA